MPPEHYYFVCVCIFFITTLFVFYSVLGSIYVDVVAAAVAVM